MANIDRTGRSSLSASLPGLIGQPLRSEQRVGTLFPRALSQIDMLAIFIAIVLFIPNASIVQATQGAGIATYAYWIIGAITFLLPGAIVTAQLNCFMPADGAIYIWTHRALGPLWAFFVGFCAWFPGVLVLLAASDCVLTLLQGVGVQLWGAGTNWFAAPWQQGLVVLAVLLLTGWIATKPLPLIMRIAKRCILLYGVAIFLVGLAGFVWLFSGHAPSVSFTPRTPGFEGQNIVLYGIIVLALLGVEVPFNMAAETSPAKKPMGFLRWGVILVVLAYLLGTFGVMAVVPSAASSSPYSTLTAVKMVFGTPVSILVGLSFITFFVMAAVIYNVSFARILVVSALDHRLPAPLSRVNRHAVPVHAIAVQVVIAVVIALFTYFVGPLLAGGDGATFSSRVYTISQATTAIIWCISMLFLFIDLPVLLHSLRKRRLKVSGQLIAPRWLLWLSSIVGGIASLLGIWTTLSMSWDIQLIPSHQWSIAVGIATLVCLIAGLIGSAYPRLLSSLEEQTTVARENARLYHELHLAYTRLHDLDQLKDAFIMTASHELRTPLTIVQGYLELLRMMEDAEPAMRHAFLEKACRACDELVVLQANIMDASRLELDAATLQCTCVSLKDICDSVIDLFEPLLLQEKRTLNIEVAPHIVVLADETRLKQILHNLLANALRYSPPQTPISIVCVEQETDMVRISVIDQGRGIPHDQQEAIFDKFVRLERDMHGTVRGSGLGLFISRRLVEAMRGTIMVESSGVKDEGSTFSFTLPLAHSVPVEAQVKS